MCVTIKSKRLTGDKLVNLLKELNGHFQYLIVADWQDIHFVKFNPDHDAIPKSYTGRAFGVNAELRWRRDEENDLFLCRLISENERGIVDNGWEALDIELDPTPTDNNYLLWGELLNDEKAFYQARIPKKLEYPIENELFDEIKAKKDKPLTLLVREYKQNSRTVFDRFIRIELYKSEKGA